MSAGPQIPDVERARVVLMQRHGLGWRVGVGTVTAGAIEGEATSHATDRSAEAAALTLSDELDLMVLRA